MKVEIPFSEDSLDQIHLIQCGGHISIKADGELVFQFQNQKQYQQYKNLKEAQIEN